MKLGQLIHASSPPPPHPHPFPQLPPPLFPFLPSLHTPPLPSFVLSSIVWVFSFPLSLSSNPDYSSGPNQSKLSNLVPAPLASPLASSNIPTIKTSQNIPPTTREHGGSKRSFRIDTKLFSFSFDFFLGGRGSLIRMPYMRFVKMLGVLFQ